jgi:hypothetical protein
MPTMRLILSITLGLFFLVSLCPAQTCEPPQIVANAKSNNIFSPEQEMIVGDLTLQRLSGEY